MSRLVLGGHIDRSKPLAFQFDGKTYSGFAGDTLASALVANDVRVIGRSFKYHRPRGLLTAGAEEPNGLVTLGRGAAAEPNTRATLVPLIEGLEATSQNRWPSLRFDLLSVNQLVAPLFAAGFYYKTFMWPSRFWEKVYEPMIRRAAGLGRLSGLPDPDSYDHEHGFCDLLVIGGGPAGLAAALPAARAGLRVFLVEDDIQLGGRLLAERHEIGGLPGAVWAGQTARELASYPRVRIFTRTQVFGLYDGQQYGAIERLGDDRSPGQPRQRLWKIAARRAILASGAIERPIVFGNNDRPGIMTASAISTYVNRYAALPGSRPVLFTTNDSGWRTAADLVAAGVEIAAIADTRQTLPDFARALPLGSTRLYPGARLVSVEGATVSRVILSSGGREHRIRADLLGVAGGWDPAIGLASHLGARPHWSEASDCFLAQDLPPGLSTAGAAAGAFVLGAALASGMAMGRAATEALGMSAPPLANIESSEDWASVSTRADMTSGRGKAFVDFQHDVTTSDIALAVREGFVSVEHLKRYTTLGMATDQGKTSSVNGQALLAAALGKSMVDAGTILSRPPVQPVAIGALAGSHRDMEYRPVRETASHAWSAASGAQFVDAGLWKRARWFAHPGDANWQETIAREVKAVRGGVGVCDISTLGKIDILGPDAGTLLDRLYVNGFSGLAEGKARYGLMLREDGFVLDDGTTTRVADDRFFLTTTTANAARVMQHIDFARQILWPELDVQAISATEQWATCAIAGPRSRALLAAMFPGDDLSNEGLPYMGARALVWNGGPARLFRLSFSGELAYELAVPAMHGDALLRDVLRYGAAFDILPYGTEALGVMRIEKGHVAGPELNGRTSAHDLGMGRMLSGKKDFIGRAMAARPALTDPARPRLIGLRPTDGRSAIAAGAHLIARGKPAQAAHDEGHVSSAAFSPTLGHPIALAFLAHGPERHGEIVVAHDPVRGRRTEAEVCAPIFVDPEGKRVRD